MATRATLSTPSCSSQELCDHRLAGEQEAGGRVVPIPAQEQTRHQAVQARVQVDVGQVGVQTSEGLPEVSVHLLGLLVGVSEHLFLQ
jgi:hypothetical protein